MSVSLVASKRNLSLLPSWRPISLGGLGNTTAPLFSKGFRSRVSYWSTVEPNKYCNYISEILDARLLSPLFMVSGEGNPGEVFVHLSPEKCWELVVEKVNSMNRNFYQDNKKRGMRTNPFHVQKLNSIKGLEMFGLSESTVLQDGSDLVAQENDLNPLVRITAPIAINLNPRLQESFKKENLEELRALETVFADLVLASSNARQEDATLSWLKSM